MIDAREALRAAIGQERARLRAGVPNDREAAVSALLQTSDLRRATQASLRAVDLVTGRSVADFGGNLALALVVAGPGSDGRDGSTSPEGLTGWAATLLDACDGLAAAGLVLGHVETGCMRLATQLDGAFDAWIASSRTPTTWRERADAAWWAGWSARQAAAEARMPLESADAAPGGTPDDHPEAFYRETAAVRVEAMAWQLGYPPDAVLGGSPVRMYREVLARLLAGALRERDRGAAPAFRDEGRLVGDLAAALGADADELERVVSGFMLGSDNADYHAAVPGAAAAPLVRVGDRVVPSPRGLTTEPLLFLARELRRRDPQGWHNAAFAREDVFRRDLYALFADKRFVTSPRRIALRRQGGDLRTDIDAAVFDRKTGALGLFELKSQDPFARSPAELARQRDNVLSANRQVSGVLEWVQRTGADAVLARVDPAVAKRFRVRSVFPFVLGRFLARFDDGPPPDRRAAWGTWADVLRLRDGQPFAGDEANPLAALHAALSKDVPPLSLPEDAPPRAIEVGALRLTVYPAFAALRAAGR